MLEITRTAHDFGTFCSGTGLLKPAKEHTPLMKIGQKIQKSIFAATQLEVLHDVTGWKAACFFETNNLPS